MISLVIKRSLLPKGKAMTIKCAKCKEIFSRNYIYTIPSEWNYDLKICKDCYREIKGDK
jgi:NAD-dependent SIR2 family protein deacetylase